MPLTRHDTIEGFRDALDAERAEGRTIGVVPTMGYLHEGHLALLRRAASERDVAAATIFVNPLQIAPNEDFDTYPRDVDRDLVLAEGAGVRHVLVPSVEEMYPEGPERVLTEVTVAELAEGLESTSRPGHFAGVATVIAKLFAIFGRCTAYFGEKDWQQLEIVRRIVFDLSFPIEIVACPTVREPDGLAMSTRNVYLTPEQRRAATVLYRALRAAQADPDRAREAMVEVIDAEPLAELDYAEVVGDRLLVAARLGSHRIIDNMPLRE